MVKTVKLGRRSVVVYVGLNWRNTRKFVIARDSRLRVGNCWPVSLAFV